MTSLWVQFKLFSNFISGTVLRGQVTREGGDPVHKVPLKADIVLLDFHPLIRKRCIPAPLLRLRENDEYT